MLQILTRRAGRFTLKWSVFTLKFIFTTTQEFFEKRGLYLAAAISFYSLFSLFPLVLLILLVFSLVLGTSGAQEIADRLVGALQQLVPALTAETATLLRGLLSDSLARFSAVGGVTAISITTLTLFMASIGVFGSIRNSVNSIWGISAKRNFLLGKLIDVALTLGAIVLLFLSAGISIVNSSLESIFGILQPGVDFNFTPVQLIASLLSPVVTFLIFAALFYILPVTRMRWYAVIPTAIGTAVAFEIAKQVFILVAGSAGSGLGSIYGFFANIILLLAFVYTAAIILLAGALVTSKFVLWLNTVERQRLNTQLSENLVRMRASTTLVGISAPVPSGASRDALYSTNATNRPRHSQALQPQFPPQGPDPDLI